MQLPTPTLEIIHLKEPELSFGHGQRSDHPKDGLFLFGPHAAPAKLKEISIGAVGTKAGLKHLRTWAISVGGYISVPPPGKTEKTVRLHLADFPGVAEAFGITFNPADFVHRTIDDKELETATRTLNHHESVRKAVDLYIREIELYDKNEEKNVDVWLLVLPELVFDRCKPLSRRTGLQLEKREFGKRQTARQPMPLFAGVIDQSDEEIFDDVPDFHRQAKARLVKLGHTSQLLRETTLAPAEFLNKAGYPIRKLQEPASVAWNIATGLYYKTQPEPPWRIADMRPGVCYIGLVFKMIPNHPQEHACCAAQMFLNEGDGMVFRGANGPWMTGDDEFHLAGSEAKRLIKTVLDTFRAKHGVSPKELFIHGKTSFTNEEWEAFCEATPKETTVVGVKIRPTNGETKLTRDSDYPVLRGTAMLLNERNAYLWTNGFVPRLDTYIGPETPNPLMVTILRSSGAMPKIRDVLADIMRLTKINYNACHYNDGLPVTVRFADKVGDVLTMGSAKDSERQPLKFYI